ncbi:DUF748 domain-containing protein [Ideonella sp. BN130291]|uniref:DUF748 domain-containing protein n=1 Tax=Ideonella sp. BN130291 TaxID=3112940 RepID=UPI002E26E37E|nr:DUF748 domain-containing protein [Ideonella sp. BN130291]
MRPLTRRLLISLAALGTLAVVLLLAYHFALQRLQAVLLDALGPRASVDAIDLGWTGVEVRNLRIRAERGGRRPWPAADELRAERVRVRPDLASLFGGRWRIGRVEVDKAYLSLYRTRDGKLHLLPALLERPARTDAPSDGDTPAAAAPLVLLDRVTLRDAEVDFYDASVRQPAHRMRLAALQAEVRDIRLPTVDQPMDIAVQALFKGPHRDGTLKINGTLTPATHDAALKADFRGVELVALEPYLLKVAEGGVKSGTLDLALKADVKNNRLQAPGTLTLTQVELRSGGSFAGVPQRAVLAAMGRDGRIELHFTLAGRLDDPNFSLNEDLATRIASAMAEKLGVSMGGVVEGLGGVIKGLMGR